MVAGLDEVPFTPRCWEDAVGLFEDSSSTSPSSETLSTWSKSVSWEDFSYYLKLASLDADNRAGGGGFTRLPMRWQFRET